MKPQAKKQNRIQRTDKKVEESLSYTVEVTDKEGRVLEHISAPSHSYAQQWNQLINVPASETIQTVKDTGGIGRSVQNSDANFAANAPIGNDFYGIRVGKGTTAVAITDYALGIRCDEGTGTDQFNHQLVEFTEPAVVSSSCSFEIVRTMINNSGATITVSEIGCYFYMYSWQGLAFRDVLPGEIN
ncbi:hypothetical protein ES703_110741 [subsurface metagenome]